MTLNTKEDKYTQMLRLSTGVKYDLCWRPYSMTVKCRTAITTLFSYFDLCPIVKVGYSIMFIYVHIISYLYWYQNLLKATNVVDFHVPCHSQFYNFNFYWMLSANMSLLIRHYYFLWTVIFLLINFGLVFML